MDLAFDGKTALVTGAASGIGRAVAVAFARGGARVVVADRDKTGAEETAHLSGACGVESLVVCVDVADAASVEHMVEQAVHRFDRLDCAFNSAGVAAGGGVRLADFDEETFDRLMAINVRGVFLSMKYELRQMLAQGGGAVVNIGSIASLSGMSPVRFGSTASPGYVASKHAVAGLTRAAAMDYAKDSIRVNAVCPGMVGTPMYEEAARRAPERGQAIASMHPMGRIAEPEEVADAVLWLCSERSGFVTGHLLAVDGGYGAA
jgi:NAD(P)-dependent dehydrogenase (short-subunit alcohol dehydrogenase family)